MVNIIFLIITIVLLVLSAFNFIKLVKYLKESGKQTAENSGTDIKRLTKRTQLNYAVIAGVIILWCVLKSVL